jgi:uncharacterized protein
MRVVADTNIVISALGWAGQPRQLLQAAADGLITLYTSPMLIEELRDVIHRPHIVSVLTKWQSTPQTALTYYQQLTVLVSPLSTPRVVLNDSDDDHVIAAAVAANANLIVSGDAKHLLPLKVHNGIQIVNVRTLMAIIKKIG